MLNWEEIESFRTNHLENEVSGIFLEEDFETLAENQSIKKMDNIAVEALEAPVIESIFTESNQPASLVLFGEAETFANWNEVLFKFCQSLLFRRPYSIAKLDQQDRLNSNGIINFSHLESDITGDKERLSNGLWVSKNNNKEDTIKLCHMILELTGFSQESLIVNDMRG